MKTIIYSANIGDYDNFNNPVIYDKNVRYILFTDNKYIKSDVWEICHTDLINETLDSRKLARYIKVNPHIVLPKHDINIWIDHCFIPKFTNVNELFKKMEFTKDKNIMIFPHSWRKCIYEESKKVLEQKLDSKLVVENQMLKYREEGFPKNFGLFETGFMVRRNVDKVNEFNNIWWNEINNGSGRDQLSNMYASWKTSLVVFPIKYGESTYKNPFLEPKTKHNVKLTF